MASRHRSSKEDRHGHKHGRHARESRDNHAADDMPRDGPRESRSRHSHRKSHDMASDHRDTRSRHARRQSVSPGTDSSDEILIKHRGMGRSDRSSVKDDISRQLKNIEKAQREALRPSSSSSQEIHIHYVPVVTTSASPPLAVQHSRSLSSAASDPDGHGIKRSKSNASENFNQLKDLTKSLVRGYSFKTERSKSRSRRSKHEKRGKHGKRKVTSKYLEPLAQRWICYECGRLRSNKIQIRHPLQEGQKMQPNWCGKCRVHGELHGRPLNWDGQRHYCWGCGIVRSRAYHHDNPIAGSEESTPNYCKPCRELSPNFDYNLREASEVGSAVKVRETAFHRQMAEAELSDIDEDEDDKPSGAPGKENQDPREKKGPRATNSFMLKNCSFKTKTTSDASSEGSLPLRILKALQLDEDKDCTSRSGGVRLSTSSYESPSVELPAVEGFGHGAQCCKQHQGSNDAASEVDDLMMDDTVDASKLADNGQASSPTIIAAPVHPVIPTSLTKKKVHWIRDDHRSTDDSTRPYSSDSGFSSGYRSEVSMKSTASRGRVRRDPATPSTGSPPEREGAATIENVGDSMFKAYECVDASPFQPIGNCGCNFDRDILIQASYGDPPREAAVEDMSAFTATQPNTLSGYPGPMAPSPPQSFKSIHAAHPGFDDQLKGQIGQSSCDSVAPSPTQDVPNFSRPYQSPSKSPSKPYLGLTNQDPTNPIARPAYACVPQPPTFRSSAAFSDSTTRRDFSGYEAPGIGGRDFDGPDLSAYGSPQNSAGDGDSYFTPAHNEGRGFAPPPSYDATFDFSQFGGADPAADCGPGEKFVREKKFTRAAKTQTPKRPYSWRLYDDGDADEGGERGDCEWKDGNTTIHRSGGPGRVVNSGNQVTILLIEEIDSDVELTGAGSDSGSDSELGTVINASVVKSICAA